MSDVGGPPRVVLITALLVAVAAVATVLMLAARRQPIHQPVAIAAVPAPRATARECDDLLKGLPQRLGNLDRATVTEPVPDGAAAWGDRDEPVVLRCGLDQPVEFVVGSPIQVVDRVQWFLIREAGRSTWYTVDRPVYIALTLPPGSGPDPIQQLSDVIDATVPEVPINPGPPR